MGGGMLLDSFSIGGYRSFGPKIQRFESLSQINLFIGQNNSGKSNVLRFLHEIYPQFNVKPKINLAQLDKHLNRNAPFSIGISLPIALDPNTGRPEVLFKELKNRLREDDDRYLHRIHRVLVQKAALDGTQSVWFDFDEHHILSMESWTEAFSCLDDNELYNLWQGLIGYSGGNRDSNWVPESLREIQPELRAINTELIPAIRKVGTKGSVSEEFSGEGIIERLAKLQNPDVHSQKDRDKFQRINLFLQNVTDNKSAEIEIPYKRDTILVHMDGKTLPLESLGTGIHEVIILASAATILDNTVICMEEPELHLNPILQKKLVRYLQGSTNNQYFISTHSAALMDTPGAEIYHIRLEDGVSISERVTSDRDKSAVCEDLGYHPSDLLQSNCVIWVEGPSDRIYLNSWINFVSDKYVEGIHYSIMFYGGRLASHLTGVDEDELLEDFISLRRLNRRGVIVIDSDRATSRARLNDTKKRLRDEFDEGPGYAWVTQGREIENYLPAKNLKGAISSAHPTAIIESTFGIYENTLKIKTKGGKNDQASKVKVARYIVANCPQDLTILDLKKQVDRLIDFICDSNPSMHVDS